MPIWFSKWINVLWIRNWECQPSMVGAKFLSGATLDQMGQLPRSLWNRSLVGTPILFVCLNSCNWETYFVLPALGNILERGELESLMLGIAYLRLLLSILFLKYTWNCQPLLTLKQSLLIKSLRVTLMDCGKKIQ